MMKYIGTSSSSQKMKNAIRSTERKIPMIAVSRIRNQNVYAFTRTWRRADASSPSGNRSAVSATMNTLMPSTPTRYETPVSANQLWCSTNCRPAVPVSKFQSM